MEKNIYCPGKGFQPRMRVRVLQNSMARTAVKKGLHFVDNPFLSIGVIFRNLCNHLGCGAYINEGILPGDFCLRLMNDI